jgi:hypothetical protein
VRLAQVRLAQVRLAQMRLAQVPPFGQAPSYRRQRPRDRYCQ